MRDLVFVDVETTGLEPDYHEIIEIAVARVDPRTLAIKAEMDAKVRPEHPDRADPEATRKNGYEPRLWRDALPLRDVLERLAPFLGGCVLAGHNVPFDRGFIEAAFRRADMIHPDVDYHLIDTASLAWPLVVAGIIERPALRDLCQYFGISNEGAHSAPADVRRTIAVYRRLMPSLDPLFHARWSVMQSDERVIVEAIVERLHEGRDHYGPWRVDDGRNYPDEALQEVMDALNYCAAALVRIRRSG